MIPHDPEQLLGDIHLLLPLIVTNASARRIGERPGNHRWASSSAFNRQRHKCQILPLTSANLAAGAAGMPPSGHSAGILD